MESASKRLQKRLGITSPQRIALRIIGKYPGITPGHLAAVLHVHAGTVSAVLRRLEAKKLVERRPHGRDGRRVALGLTPAGRELDAPDPASIEGSLSRVLESFPGEGLQFVQKFLSQLVKELESQETK